MGFQRHKFSGRLQMLLWVAAAIISFAWASPGSAQTCSELFAVRSAQAISLPRSTDLDQNHRGLFDAGLFPRGNSRWSNLCGPTCMINAAAELLSQRGVVPADSVESMKTVINQLLLERGLDRRATIDNGMEAYQLADLTGAYFKRLGLRANVKVVGVEVDAFTDSAAGKHSRTNITGADLLAKPSRVIIANYEIWKARTPQHIEPGDASSGWTFGHFVLLENVQMKADGNLSAHIRDPRAFIENEIELRAVHSEGLGISTFELGRNSGQTLDRNPASHAVFTSVIIIDVEN